MILPVFQPFGASSHRLAQQAGALHQTKATHTGTLDPMASGVLVILTDQDRFDKTTYSSWKKTYQFGVLVGIATDTHDLLGQITAQLDPKQIPTQDKLATLFSDHLDQMTGTFDQIQPVFSSLRYQGKSGFTLAKDGQAMPQPSNQVALYQTKVGQVTALQPQALTKKLVIMRQLTNDFRQEKIIPQWETWMANQDTQKYPIVTCTATVSKRTYIRGIVRDLSQTLDLPLTTFEIIRTANGPYTINDCICLV